MSSLNCKIFTKICSNPCNSLFSENSNVIHSNNNDVIISFFNGSSKGNLIYFIFFRFLLSKLIISVISFLFFCFFVFFFIIDKLNRLDLFLTNANDFFEFHLTFLFCCFILTAFLLWLFLLKDLFCSIFKRVWIYHFCHNFHDIYFLTFYFTLFTLFLHLFYQLVTFKIKVQEEGQINSCLETFHLDKKNEQNIILNHVEHLCIKPGRSSFLIPLADYILFITTWLFTIYFIFGWSYSFWYFRTNLTYFYKWYNNRNIQIYIFPNLIGCIFIACFLYFLAFLPNFQEIKLYSEECKMIVIDFLNFSVYAQEFLYYYSNILFGWCAGHFIFPYIENLFVFFFLFLWFLCIIIILFSFNRLFPIQLLTSYLNWRIIEEEKNFVLNKLNDIFMRGDGKEISNIIAKYYY